MRCLCRCNGSAYRHGLLLQNASDHKADHQESENLIQDVGERVVRRKPVPIPVLDVGRERAEKSDERNKSDLSGVAARNGSSGPGKEHRREQSLHHVQDELIDETGGCKATAA